MANIATVESELWWRSKLRLSSANSDFPVTLISASDRTFSVDLSKEITADLPGGLVPIPWLEFPVVDILGVTLRYAPIRLQVVTGPNVGTIGNWISVRPGSDLNLSGRITDTLITVSGLAGEATAPVLDVGLRGEKGDRGSGLPEGAVTARQFRSALASQARTHNVISGLSDDPDNAATVQWLAGAWIISGDPLWTAVKTTLAYSDPQMATLMTLAATFDQ